MAPDAHPLFTLREAVPADDDALAHLARQAPDGGAVAFAPRLHVPARLATPPGFAHSTVVVAELSGLEDLAGTSRLRVGALRLDGELRPVALLSSLVVHPRARRRGIAAAMTRWRIERAQELAGDDVVVFANIQRGNAASSGNAQAWATTTIGPVRVVPLTMRRRPPRPSRWSFGPVGADELDLVADRLQARSHDRQLSRDWDAGVLRQWLDASPVDVPVHHYLVARDGDRVVAGVGLRDEWRLQSLEVVRMATPVKVANLALRVVPKDGVMRNVTADKLWHDDGAEDALRDLLRHVRWAWRDRASAVLVELDARSPELGLVGTRPWSPTTSFDIAVRAPSVDRRRLIEPVL